MEISPGIEIVGAALWIKKSRLIIINDLHFGYEESLHHKGILIPKSHLKEIIQQMEKIFKKVSPKTIIINGDLKHEFGKVLRQEGKEVMEFLDYLREKGIKIVVIQGNHDPVLTPITLKKGIEVVKECRVGDMIIVHGDKEIKTKAKRVIIGHEHPAVTIREGSKYEKYKCFLRGKWKGKELIVLPSFNPLLEGTDILKEKLLSPFLSNISQSGMDKYKVYLILKEEAYDFGELKNIRKIR